MNSLSLLSLTHLFALASHALVYLAAAVYANFTPPHRDFCVFYAGAAGATFLLFCVILKEECRKCANGENRDNGLDQ